MIVKEFCSKEQKDSSPKTHSSDRTLKQQFPFPFLFVLRNLLHHTFEVIFLLDLKNENFKTFLIFSQSSTNNIKIYNLSEILAIMSLLPSLCQENIAFRYFCEKKNFLGFFASKAHLFPCEIYVKATNTANTVTGIYRMSVSLSGSLSRNMHSPYALMSGNFSFLPFTNFRYVFNTSFTMNL